MIENWAAPVRLLTSAYGGFGKNDIVVVQFKTGSIPSGSNLLKITGAEYQWPPTQRVAALSDKPCDFVGLRDPVTFQPYWGATNNNTTTVTVPFTIDNPANLGFYPILHVDTVYFLNIKIAAEEGCATTCDIFVELVKYNNP